jgi:vacuolar iron transporter family protein
MSAPLPLPSRPNTSVKQKKPPVWPIDSSEPGVETPPAAKCARSAQEGGICCKELLDHERTLIDPDIVRDV